MGLDTTHNCWHGPYSAFGRFREAVAVAAEWPGIQKDYPARCYYGWWDDDYPYEDVIEVFFAHSDCEGYIFPQHLEPLVSRLVPLLPKMSADEPHHGATGYSPMARLATFIAGLQKASEEWEIVRFH